MIRFLLCFALLAATFRTGVGADDAAWRKALPGWKYAFPRDHFTHDDFLTEWWYVTGNLQGASGRKYGYQFTIFRRGIRQPGSRSPVTSRFIVDHMALGHFAFTDVKNERFYFNQKFLRGAFGEAGFGRGEEKSRLTWMDDWELRLNPGTAETEAGQDGGTFTLSATQPGVSIRLNLKSLRPPVIHGSEGISQKSAGEGNASHYYSLTRLESAGEVTVEGKTEAVTGLSWLDREWATNQLSSDQAGWDWFSLHLSDGRDLMLYRLRRKDGTADPFSSGTLVANDGTSVPLKSSDFTLTPVPGKANVWTSSGSGGVYPVLWNVKVPSLNLNLEVRPVFPQQELLLKPVSYWEGAVEARGTSGGTALAASGYLEMTGYSGPLQALQR